MPVSSTSVGQKIPGISTEVTTRMLMAYAAGIGETSPSFFDDAGPQGVVAVPSFCAKLEGAVLNDEILSNDALNLSNDEAIRIVRTGQDSTFHRQIFPDDKLHTSGCITQVKETTAGALIVQKVETVVEATQEPVVTSWISWIMRGGKVAGPDTVIEVSHPLDLDVPLSYELVATEIFIPRKAPHVYAECSGIWNPINTQRKTALAAGLPDIILQGMATWSIAGREILKAQGHNNPHKMKRFTANFSAMIIPGGTIRILQGRCRSNPEAVYYCVENQQGDVAVSGFVFLEAI